MGVKASVFLTAFTITSSEAGQFNPIIGTQVQSETMRAVGAPSIEDSHVDLFANNVYHVSQQKGSILMPFMLVEGMVMNAKSINRIGTLGDPPLYGGRGSKITATNPVNDVRWLTAQRYWHACFVDNWDQIRTLWDIKDAYSMAMAMSFGRLQDRVAIAAALGTVWTGPNKNVQVTLPLTQKVGAYNLVGNNTGVGLNLKTLKLIRKKMKKSFAIQRGQTIVMAITAEETDSLLNEAETTNRDYTTILTLMQGEIAAFYGMIFAETQLIPHTATDTHYNTTTGEVVAAATDITTPAQRGKIDAGKGLRCFAFISGESLCFGINQNLMVRVSERADLHYNIQIYYAMEVGATRKEEVKVVEVITLDPSV